MKAFVSPDAPHLPATDEPRRVPGQRLHRWWATAVQTADYLLGRGPDAFLRHHRALHGGTVFRVYLWRPQVALVDPAAIAALFDAPDLVPDDGAGWFRPPAALAGAPARSRPALALRRALYREWLPARLPNLGEHVEQVTDRYFEHWSAGRPFSFRDELENFAADAVFRAYLEASVDPADVRLLYLHLHAHPFPRFAGRFPRSCYSRSVQAHARLLQAVKDSPGFACALAHGRAAGTQDPDTVAREVLRLLGVHAFLGLQNLLKSVVGELSSQPAWALRVRHEVITAFGPQPHHVALRRLENLPLLDGWMREVQRLHPPVSNVFVRATRDRMLQAPCGTYAIHRGDHLMGALAQAHRDPATFRDPDVFDPLRFHRTGPLRPAGRVHGQAVPPELSHHGACPALSAAVLFTKLFSAKLLTHAHWALLNPPVWRRGTARVSAPAPQGPMAVSAFERLR